MITATPNGQKGLRKPFYQDSAVTIYHGDCFSWLFQAPECFKGEVTLTDPPYGVGLRAKQHKWFKREGAGYSGFEDTPEYIRDVVVPIICLCISKFSRVAVTPGTRSLFLYPPSDEIGCIFNASGTGSGKWGFMCSTPVLFYGTDPYLSDGKGRRPNSWQQPANDYAADVDHPCPKPIGMMRWLVDRVSRPGESILDPFMGSGTTLRAAKDLGRRAIGFDIDERSCEIAAKRMEQEVMDFGAGAFCAPKVEEQTQHLFPEESAT